MLAEDKHRAGRPAGAPSRAMPSYSCIDQDHGVASATDLDASAAAACVPSRPGTGRGRPEDFGSFLRTQDKVDAICKEHGIPKGFTARPAGDLRANSTPPGPGAICVYARALDAGMRLPLHGFFREALAHFGIAPAQLTPNAWRIMAGFLVLCRSVGVPPSLAVFRHLFALSTVNKREKKGWYFFRSRDSSALRFTGMPNRNWVAFKYWKHEFFFLSSPEPWPCPVKWGEPSKRSFKNPELAGEEKKSAAKLRRAHGGAAVDLRTYLSNSNLAAAMITTTLLPPPSSSCTCIISSPEGMDPSVYDMMKTMLAEKAAASAKKVKAELSSDAAGSPSSCGKKRTLHEANGEDGPLLSLLNTPLSSVMCSPPPGFPPKPQNFSGRLDRDTTDWELAREPQECVFTGNEPFDGVASSHAANATATNYTSFSLGYSLEQEDKLVEAKSELASEKQKAEQEKAKAGLAAAGAELAKAKAGLAAAEAEVVKAKAELTAAKRAADAAEPEPAMEGLEVAKAKAKLDVAKRALEEELESAKAAALQQLLCCEDHVRRRAGHALEGYQRWRTGRAPAGRAA